jgi:hypothetical protein
MWAMSDRKICRGVSGEVDTHALNMHVLVSFDARRLGSGAAASSRSIISTAIRVSAGSHDFVTTGFAGRFDRRCMNSAPRSDRGWIDFLRVRRRVGGTQYTNKNKSIKTMTYKKRAFTKPCDLSNTPWETAKWRRL